MLFIQFQLTWRTLNILAQDHISLLQWWLLLKKEIQIREEVFHIFFTLYFLSGTLIIVLHVLHYLQLQNRLYSHMSD